MTASSPPGEQKPLTDLQPSQLLVSEAKLRDVLTWWDADSVAPGTDDGSSVEPLPYLDPIEDLGFDPDVVASDRVVLADGHTRALAAELTGTTSLQVVRDPDRDHLSMAVYRTCVEWCLEEGVHEPADLVGRVVSAERHREEWVERCQALDAE